MNTKLVATLLVSGWLADALSATDATVDAAIAAYQSKEFDRALELLTEAEGRLGERAELQFDRGLFQLGKDDREAAKQAFFRATESDDLALRGSAHYELGNLAFDAESWDEAIAAYIEALKANPEHENAKWNLELAMQRKRQAEEQKQKEQEEQERDEEPSEDTEGEPQSGTDGAPEKPEGGTDGEPERPPEEPPQGGDASGEPEDEDRKQQQPPAEDEGEPEQREQPPEAPRPLDRADLDQALRQLDAQDEFRLGRPAARAQPPAKDW